jgi:hypothetical protein
MPHTPPTTTDHCPPIAVWHTGHDRAGEDLTVDDAMLLLSVYTTCSATVVDLDADPALALVARASARPHLPLRTLDSADRLRPAASRAELVYAGRCALHVGELAAHCRPCASERKAAR